MKHKEIMVMNGDIEEIETIYFCENCDHEMNHLHPIYFNENGAYCYDCAFKLGLIDEKDYVKHGCFYIMGGDTKIIGAYIDDDGTICVYDKRYKDPRKKTNKDYRHSKQYQEWRKQVFERDNYTCKKCGKIGGTLNAHHIKPFKDFKDERFDVNNGITLCEKCHRKIHREKDNEWIYFRK